MTVSGEENYTTAYTYDANGENELPSNTTANLSGVTAPSKAHGGSTQIVLLYNSLN